MVDELFEQLRVQIDVLKERNRQLEELLAPSTLQPPLEWRLTASEARVFAHLASRDVCRKEGILAALYADRIDEAPEPKIVDVFVCKLRKKVKPFGVEIETVWGQGYRLMDRQSFGLPDGVAA